MKNIQATTTLHENFKKNGVENVPFIFNKDEDDYVDSFVHVDTLASVSGFVDEEGLSLVAFNDLFIFRYDDYEDFEKKFWEIHQELLENSVTAYVEESDL